MNTPLFTVHPSAPERPPAPQRGTDTLLVSNSLGYALSASDRGGRFSHPFTPFLGSGHIKLSRGLLEFIEPKIGKVPLSGDADHAQPALKLEAKVADAFGASWVCVEVEAGEDGMLDENARVEVVHSREPSSLDPKLGRCPLAMILWQRGRPLRALPIVYFNLRYVRIQPPPGGGAVRHLFL